MTAFPWVQFEMALGNDPLEPNPSFRDMSRRLNTGQISRPLGRAGTSTFVLDNSDGALDPWNTASEFYGNLLDADTADLVGTTGDWNPTLNVNLTRSLTQAYNGPASLRMQAAANGDMAASTGAGTGGEPVRPNLPYTASALFRAGTTARNCLIGIGWFDSAGAFISADYSTPTADSNSAWTLVAVSATSPATAAFANVLIQVNGAATTELHYVDTISLTGGNWNTLWYAGGRNGLLQPGVKVRCAGWWNHLTAEQSDITTSTAGWNGLANAVVTRSVAQTHFATASLRLEAAGAGDMVAGTDSATGGRPVLGSTEYLASCVFRADTTARNCLIGIGWFDSAGAFISADYSTPTADSNSAWTLVAVSATSPPTAAFANVAIQVVGAAGGERHYAADFSLNPGTSTLWYVGGPLYVNTGYVTNWGVEWENIKSGDSAVEVVDAFRFLTLAKRPGTAYFDAVMAVTPRAYWRLGENANSPTSGGIIIATDSSGNARDGTYRGVSVGRPGLVPAETDGSAEFTRGGGGWVETPITALGSGTGDFTVLALVHPRSFDPAGKDRIWRLFTVGSQNIQVILRADGTVRAFFSDGTNGGTLDTSAPVLLDRTSQIAVVKSGTTGPGNWKIYINKVDVSSGASVIGSGNVSVTANAGQIGGHETASVGQGAFDGFIDEVVIVDSALNSTQIGDIYDANFGFNETALAGDRIEAILDLRNWPAADRDIDAGQFLMQPVTEPLYDTPPLAYVATGDGSLVESEGWPAAFFISGAGKTVFHDRAHSAPSSAATFSDASSNLYYDPGPGPNRSGENVWTQVVLQAENGQPQTAGDASNLGETLTRTGLKNADDADVATMASDLFDRYSTPRDSIAQLVIHPIDEPAAMFPQVLTRDLGDVITVVRTSLPGGGAPFTGEFRIVGITHNFEAQDWHTTWTLEPT